MTSNFDNKVAENNGKVEVKRILTIYKKDILCLQPHDKVRLIYFNNILLASF